MKEKMKKVRELQDDGFQPVTDRYGNFRVDKDSNRKCKALLMQLRKICLRSRK